MRGLKYDQGKVALTLLPWSALKWIARVLEYGAAKYRRGNWIHLSGPEDLDRVRDALLRHLAAAFDPVLPEVCDRESGLPHLAHAGANVLFLLAQGVRNGSLGDPEALTFEQAATFARLRLAQAMRDGTPLAVEAQPGAEPGRWHATIALGPLGTVSTEGPPSGLGDALRALLRQRLGWAPDLPAPRLAFATPSGEPLPPEVAAELT